MPMHLLHRPFTHFLHGIIPPLRMQAGILQKLSNICFSCCGLAASLLYYFQLRRKEGHCADLRHRPRLRHHRLRADRRGAGTIQNGYLWGHHHPGGPASVQTALPDRPGHGGAYRPAEAGCDLRGGAVLQHEYYHRHRRGPWPGRAAVRRGAVRHPAV